MEHFVAGTPARTAAELVSVNRNTAILFYRKLREVIAARIEDDAHQSGDIEVDESYFGGVRKGKRDRGAAGKVPVFGLLKRGGKVYTRIIPNVRKETLLPILKSKIRPDSIVYTDSFDSYNILHVSGFKHRRVNHGRHFAAAGGKHINGIENFWNQAKRHLRKYNGIPRHNFNLFLKECEWRFNYGPPRRLLGTLLRWSNLKPRTRP